jgi:hypothetical protein
MNDAYQLYYSQYLWVEVIREILPVLIASGLLYGYYKGSISVLEVLLYAFATETFNMLVVGPTFNATLLISIAFLAEMAHRILTQKVYIRKDYLFLLLLPLISSLLVLVLVDSGKVTYTFADGKSTDLLLRPLYFYLKTFLPLFAIGAKIALDRERISFDLFFHIIKRIATWSCSIALLQILVVLVTHNHALAQLLGLQERYLSEDADGGIPLRVQAFFSEPKTFGAFLALSIPVLVRDKKWIMGSLCMILGILTQSQTFWTDLGSLAVIFGLFKSWQNLRLQVLGGLGVMILLFLGIAGSTAIVFSQYQSNQNNPFIKLVLERSVSRYDPYGFGKKNVIMGIPLQEDLEFPVYEFMQDHPVLFLTGYGPGNSAFISPEYFYGTQSYDLHVAGVGGTNLNMRWLYMAFEFGIPSFICFFWVLTRINPRLGKFERNYFAGIWVCLFFSQIDLVFLCVALLSYYYANHEHLSGQ